jgi:hypothetical protein
VVGVLDVGGHIDAVARIGKAANHHVTQDGVVFDKQNSHRIQGVVEGGLPCERWVSGPSVAPSDKTPHEHTTATRNTGHFHGLCRAMSAREPADRLSMVPPEVQGTAVVLLHGLCSTLTSC